MNPSLLNARLQRLTRKNDTRHEALREMFGEAGCAGANLTEQTVEKKRPGNVICMLPGETDSTIVVGAHFDFVDRGDGAVDDWSGAAMLPSLYQSVASRMRRHRFVFVGFAAEERGLIGSRYFVRHLSPEERASTRAMVNLECLGLEAPKVWATRADKRLAGLFGAVARAVELPFEGVNVEKVGDDDTHPFADAKIPVLPVHSITQETLGILHSPRDRLKAIKPEQYAATYKLLALYLAYLDAQLD